MAQYTETHNEVDQLNSNTQAVVALPNPSMSHQPLNAWTGSSAIAGKRSVACTHREKGKNKKVINAKFNKNRKNKKVWNVKIRGSQM